MCVQRNRLLFCRKDLAGDLGADRLAVTRLRSEITVFLHIGK